MIWLHQLKNILNEEFKVTQTQKEMAAKKVAAGLTGAVDQLEFNLREDEIRIEQKQIEQQHSEVHQKLTKLFGDSVTDIQLEKIEFSSLQKVLESAKTFNLEKTIEFQKAELLVQRAESEKKELRSEFLPKLDFIYSAGRLTPTEDANASYNESKIALLLTVPLFSGFDTYYKTKASSLSLQALQKSKDQINTNMNSDYAILKTKQSELITLFQINEKKLVSVQKYFDLTFSEYKRGVKNSPDLVNATERLFTTKKNKYNYLKELERVQARLELF